MRQLRLVLTLAVLLLAAASTSTPAFASGAHHGSHGACSRVTSFHARTVCSRHPKPSGGTTPPSIPPAPLPPNDQHPPTTCPPVSGRHPAPMIACVAGN